MMTFTAADKLGLSSGTIDMASVRRLNCRALIKKICVLALTAGLTSPFGHVLAAEKAAGAPGQPEKDKPLWELGFVAAGAYLPHYPAAAESQTRFLPFPWLVYRGEIFRAGEDGVLSGRIIKSERVELDVSFSGSLPVSADDNDAREGMPELDWLGGIGPRLQINLFKTGNRDRNARIDFELPVRGVFSTDFSEAPEWRGVVAAPGIRYRNKNVSHSGLNLDLSAEVIFATEELMDYYYEVDPRFARSNRPAYDADAGYLGSKFSFNMNRKFGSRITGFLNTNLQWFSGSTNSDSPLSLETVNYGIVAGIKVALFQSDDRVRD
jgi:outer membrane scaffolding protein for murein synthesis (MipA/OmpV family)